MQPAAWERDIGSRIYTVDTSEVDEFLEVPEELGIDTVVGFGIPAQEIQGLNDRNRSMKSPFRKYSASDSICNSATYSQATLIAN